jgi:hypothetical protein
VAGGALARGKFEGVGVTCYCEAYYNFVCPDCRRSVLQSTLYYGWIRRYRGGAVEKLGVLW